MALYKPIQGYEELYLVSSDGDIIALPRIVDNGYRKAHRKQHKMKQKTRAGVYKFVMLSKNGEQKAYSVHRLVAQAFLDNPDNLPEVNHKDENPENNHVDNLEWCTRQYNIEYSKGKRVHQIDMKTGKILAEYKSIKFASRMTGISRTAINNAVTGYSHSAGGYCWKYCD